MRIIPNNKLVRDRIPEIIRRDGSVANIRVLDDEAYLQALRTKLQEEVQEYLKDPNLEELADISEILHALAATHGHTPEELESLRARKSAERGGFSERIFLESAEVAE
jgi:predicted house-cleaning noncanonical NTP pyrophosphatase (MazG superfamily)